MQHVAKRVVYIFTILPFRGWADKLKFLCRVEIKFFSSNYRGLVRKIQGNITIQCNVKHGVADIVVFFQDSGPFYGLEKMWTKLS